jgi:hypothetical protein
VKNLEVINLNLRRFFCSLNWTLSHYMFIDGVRFSAIAYECKAESSSCHLGILIRKLHTAADH